MAFLDWLSSMDPTKISKADTSQVEEATKKIGEAGAAGQKALQERMGKIEAPTLERVAGPQAGKVDTGFLEALRGQLPSGAQALQRMGAQDVSAQRMAAEATGLTRAAAMGEAPSAAQLQQRQAFEQAIAAQMAAQAGAAYDPARLYQSQVAGQQLMAQQSQQAGILAAQEQERARAQYVQAAQTGAGLGMQQQELALRAQQGDVQAQLQLANIQAGLAGQQAQLQTQTGIAGAQLQAQQIAQQAELQQQAQAQLNQLTQMYVQLGLSSAQAEQAAAKDLFSAEQARQTAQSGARAQIFGGVLSGLAGAGAAAAGKKA